MSGMTNHHEKIVGFLMLTNKEKPFGQGYRECKRASASHQDDRTLSELVILPFG